MCEQSGTPDPAEEFLRVLRSPYQELANNPDYQDPPIDGDKDYKSFCGN